MCKIKLSVHTGWLQFADRTIDGPCLMDDKLSMPETVEKIHTHPDSWIQTPVCLSSSTEHAGKMLNTLLDRYP